MSFVHFATSQLIWIVVFRKWYRIDSFFPFYLLSFVIFFSFFVLFLFILLLLLLLSVFVSFFHPLNKVRPSHFILYVYSVRISFVEKFSNWNHFQMATNYIRHRMNFIPSCSFYKTITAAKAKNRHNIECTVQPQPHTKFYTIEKKDIIWFIVCDPIYYKGHTIQYSIHRTCTELYTYPIQFTISLFVF